MTLSTLMSPTTGSPVQGKMISYHLYLDQTELLTQLGLAPGGTMSP